MSGLEPRPGVLRLAPYQQGQSAIEGVSNPIKLSSNESSQGPSPLAIAAYHEAGVKPELIAQLVGGILQLGALGFIGAGVN